MARKIKFALKMKDGSEVRTLEELKEHFDLESVLGFFVDGKLETWLIDRYEEEKAKAVSCLSVEDDDLKSKLCEILNVQYIPETNTVDYETIKKRNEKLRILRNVTANLDILNNVDQVVFDTEDIHENIYDVLRLGVDKVYLYGERFRIPAPPSSKINLSYIGINNPLVIFLHNVEFWSYEEYVVHFENVQFESHINPLQTKGEKLFIEGAYVEAFPLIKKDAEKGNPRAMYLLAMCLMRGYGIVSDYDEGKEWLKKAYNYKEPLSSMKYAQYFMLDKYTNEDNDSDEEESADSFDYDDENEKESYEYDEEDDDEEDEEDEYDEEAERIRKQEILFPFVEPLESLSDLGDPIAQYEYGLYLYDYSDNKEYGVEIIKQSANSNFAIAEKKLGDYYWSVEEYKNSMYWYSKAVEHGSMESLCKIGDLYRDGISVSKNIDKAIEYYMEASNKGCGEGAYRMGTLYHGEKAIEDNLDKAKLWYKIAADRGHSGASLTLSFIGLSDAMEEYKETMSKLSESGRKLTEMLNSRNVCPDCDGSGELSLGPFKFKCSTCEGTGKKWR